MTHYHDKHFEQRHARSSAAVFEGHVFERCVFDNCFLSLTADPALRSVVRNVSAKDCTLLNCQIGPAIFEEVVIDGLRTGDIAILWGPLFRHVTLKGKIGPLKVNTCANFIHRSEAVQKPFDRERRTFYKNVDWALDIREAQLDELDLSGVPARLVRRDVATQIVVTRERALRPAWRKKVSKAASLWIEFIDAFLEENEPDLILAAPKGRPKKFKSLLAGLQELRDAGVAEPEAPELPEPGRPRKPASSSAAKRRAPRA